MRGGLRCYAQIIDRHQRCYSGSTCSRYARHGPGNLLCKQHAQELARRLGRGQGYGIKFKLIKDAPDDKS